MLFKTVFLSFFFFISVFCFKAHALEPEHTAPWLLVDDFEREAIEPWIKRDTRNDTSPRIENPQITEIEQEESGNRYLLKKPAADGVVGNRKALSFVALPKVVEVGERYTFYTRINVEYFPNNHIFGLSNLDSAGIAENDYNAFEPSLRITDKAESNGVPGDWYEVWYVVDNAKLQDGGQKYDVYVKGGEFNQQQLVYKGADFRMKRERPLIYFLTNANTGPIDKPYGNGGVLYDDIYMAKGLELSAPGL